jgi:exonuclease SbcC
MKILSIKFKNVQSYGSDEQYIKFEDTGIFSIITGKNGNGKSSICNAIKYAIYGKIDGYTNAEFCNRENKSVWTKIELISKNKNIIIERGLKPDIFKLIIDGIEYDKAGKRELQEYIDNEILDISYDIFKNVFVLSVNDFKSFITMSPNDKRNIIDKIFGYDILNVIRNKVKNTRKNLKNDLKILEEELKFIDSSTNSIQEKIDKIKNSDIEDITNKQIELKNELAVLVEKRDKLTHIKNDFLNKESDIIKKQDSIKNDYYNISSEIKTLTKSIELFKSERCPTCASVFENKKEQLIELQQKYDSYVNDLKNNVEEKNHHLHIHKNIKDNILKVDNKYTEIIKSIYVLTQQYQNITSKLESNNATKDLLDLLNENIKKREQLLYDKQFSYNEDEYHNMLEIIIGDDGIKKLTLNNMIPFFNSTILSL